MPVEDREPVPPAVAEPLRDNACWCGAHDLRPFSPTYAVCGACHTLITRFPYSSTQFLVEDDARDFYGKDYWFSHQESDLAQPGILTRARTDLAERAIHWLRAILKYKQPPGRTLELGSAHGGLVALLQWAGFEAAGLEMSPWVVQFARETFAVPMYQGTLETQQIPPASLDALVLMDVLEHLPDPVGTMQRAMDLLKPDGLLLVQTPRFEPGATYDGMVAGNDPFLVQLKTDEHLFLFSEESIEQLLKRVGATDVRFERAIFGHYDMFVAASREQLRPAEPAAIYSTLAATPNGRLIGALLDTADDRDAAERRYAALVPLQADVDYLKNQVTACEADRAARLDVIHQQGAQVGQLESTIAELQARVQYVEEQWTAAERDRAARLEVIQAQGAQIVALQNDVEAARTLVGTARRGLAMRIAGVIRAGGAALALDRAVALLNHVRESAFTLNSEVPPVQTASGVPAPAADPYDRIREPKTTEPFAYSPDTLGAIEEALTARGFDLRRLTIDPAEYRAYFARAGYAERYPDYYSFNLPEKSLEHFLASQLLGLGAGDVYIDIASEHSPVPEIYARLFGCTSYRQDLAYPAGLNGDEIGGDAAAMPVPDGFASKMALHCSFEHFEGDADSRFVREIARVLRPGGRVCFAPLYLWDRFGVLTDPAVAVAERVGFDSDATVFSKPGWGNRHGRLYDAAHLDARIRRQLGDLRLTLYRVMNATDVDPSCYIQFAAVIEKPA